VIVVGSEFVGREMLGARGRSVEAQQSASLKDPVDDRVREIVIVKDIAPALRVLVRREDHRAPPDMAIVYDVVEDVRCIVAVREVADQPFQGDFGVSPSAPYRTV